MPTDIRTTHGQRCSLEPYLPSLGDYSRPGTGMTKKKKKDKTYGEGRCFLARTEIDPAIDP